MMLRACMLGILGAAFALGAIDRQDPERPVPAVQTPAVQDPKPGSTDEAPARPTAPEDAPPLDPVPEPYIATVDRRDLIQRFEPQHGLEGMYSLRALVRAGGRQVFGAEGYLVLGRKHLSLHLQAPGSDPDIPQFRSGFRRYRIENDQLEMIALVGQGNTLDGDVVLDGRGAEFTREIAVLGSTLRILDADGGYMEFVRIE